MRFLGLNLPPLTLIMLLAFLWLILLVVLLWSWLRPPRPLESPTPERDTRRQLESDAPIQLPRPQFVREVKPTPKPVIKLEGEHATDDPFDSYRPNSRRDDFDF